MTAHPTITNFSNGFRLIDWPAFTYIESTNPDVAICIDEGGRHLGQPVPGVAIPFPTRRYGEMHKHFGICEDEGGNPLAYGKGATISNMQSEKYTLAAARIGGIITYKGKRYAIRETANQNIAFDLID